MKDDAVNSRASDSASDSTSISGSTTPSGRAFKLLQYIADGGSTGNLSELGRQLDINRVTAMRLLASLEQEEAIEALPQGGHRIGMKFLALAANVIASDDLFGHGRRVLESVSKALDMSAFLVVPDESEVIYMLRVMPDVPLVSSVRIGTRIAMTKTTAGRTILASRGDQSADSDDIRAKGCAWSFSGLERGIDSCAAVVTGADGLAIAAISVAGPESRFASETQLRAKVEDVVKNAAAQLSKIMGDSSL